MVRLLTALVWAATPAPAEEAPLDWAAVRRNTAAYEAELQAEETRAALAGLDDSLTRRLAAAQTLVGAAPVGVARLVPRPPQGNAAASVEVEEAMSLLMAPVTLYVFGSHNSPPNDQRIWFQCVAIWS